MAQGSPGRWIPREGASAPEPRRERARHAVAARLRENPRTRAWLVRQFHRLLYENADRTWRDTRWQGVQVAKTPLDLWAYQEIVHDVRPEVIVETGTYTGGSALFFAHLCDLGGAGRVISIDLDDATEYPRHPRVTYVTGSSVAADVVARVRAECEDAASVMVVLDSEHAAPHVAAELDAYHDLVTPGSYLVVEDTNINGHPVEPGWGAGPHEAVEPFLAAHPEFERDREREKYYVSFNPGGWLRRR